MVKQGKYENTIEVVLTEKETPILFKKKLEELMEQGAFNSEDEAKKWIESTPIVLCVVYHKHSGMYAVEDEAVDSTFSPYDGSTPTDTINEDPDPYGPTTREDCVYYQPVWYGDDGTNDVPDGLWDFQVFPTRKVCERWLENNGYNPGDFVINKYHDDDIEDYTLIDEDGNSIQSEETEKDLDDSYNYLMSLITDRPKVEFDEPVKLSASECNLYGFGTEEPYRAIAIDELDVYMENGVTVPVDDIEDVDDYELLISAIQRARGAESKTTEEDIEIIASLMRK